MQQGACGEEGSIPKSVDLAGVLPQFVGENLVAEEGYLPAGHMARRDSTVCSTRSRPPFGPMMLLMISAL